MNPHQDWLWSYQLRIKVHIEIKEENEYKKEVMNLFIKWQQSKIMKDNGALRKERAQNLKISILKMYWTTELTYKVNKCIWMSGAKVYRSTSEKQKGKMRVSKSLNSKKYHNHWSKHFELS